MVLTLPVMKSLLLFNDKFNVYHCSWGHEKYSWQL